MLKKTMVFPVVAGLLCGLFTNGIQVLAAASPQVVIPVVETFPKIPTPFNMMDWKQKTLDYDALVFDWSTATKDYATILTDTTHYNMSANTFKIPAYYGDERLTGDYQINYSGAWIKRTNVNAFSGSDRYSNQTNSYSIVTFDGQSVRWIGSKGANYGKADVFIDGVLDVTVDCYSSTGLEQQVLYNKTGLAVGTHTIKVVVKGTKNAASTDYRIVVDEFAYDTTTTKVDNTNAAIVYNGTWSSRTNANAFWLSDQYNAVTNNYAQLTFIGQSIKWIGGKGSNYGKADVYIDGVLDTANIDCYNATGLEQQQLFSKTGLSSGQHTIKVVVKGTKNASSSDYNIVVDEFEYAATALKTDDPSALISYSGTWNTRSNASAYNGSDRYNAVANSYALYTFNGQSIRWIGGKGANYGKADVYIDGILDSSGIDCYNATALDQQVLYSKIGLSRGMHTIKVVVKGTKNASSSDYNLVIDQFDGTNYVDDDNTSDGLQDGLTVLGAVLSASLVGVDKSNQNGLNYVDMLQSFYQTSYGVAENNPHHRDLGSFPSLWYLLVPNVLYYNIGDLYPSSANMTAILQSIADKVYDMVVVLGGANADFNHQGFRFDTMTAYDQAWKEPDEAGAAAAILYMAYKKFGTAKYLQGAKWSLDFLERINYNPIYEMGLDEAVYIAARLNADEGTNYNIEKYMNWKMQRTSDSRVDWGMNASSWYGNDVHGLGAGTGYNGYAFGMESWYAMKNYVPMVKYDPRYARAVGRWMLNMANNSWIFFADQWSATHQSYPKYINKVEKVIPYEGLKKDANGIQMFAGGDPSVNRQAWELGDNTTDLALYSGSFMGILGSIVSPTNDSKIYRFDTSKTDFYKGTSYPTYLYYNPYTIAKSVQITLSGASDLYDTVSGTYLAVNVSGTQSFSIPADSSVVLVIAPANSTLTTSGNKSLINGVFVSNQTPAMTYVDQTNASIAYSGTWSSRTNSNAYNGSDKYSSSANSYAQYTFTGTTIRWIGEKGSNFGKADVYIDGVLDSSNVDCYYATAMPQQALYAKTGLSSGSHTIKVVVKGTKNASSSDNNIVIDAFQFSS